MIRNTTNTNTNAELSVQIPNWCFVHGFFFFLFKCFESPSLITEDCVDQCFYVLGAQDGEVMLKIRLNGICPDFNPSSAFKKYVPMNPQFGN